VINKIAPDIQLGDIIWGTLPFVFLIMIAVVILCLAPGIATWMPDYFMGEAIRR
jgi:TRAP-type C4-dicarboxylate transport system permease large subunit